jgi:hypothetical protein
MKRKNVLFIFLIYFQNYINSDGHTIFCLKSIFGVIAYTIVRCVGPDKVREGLVFRMRRIKVITITIFLIFLMLMASSNNSAAAKVNLKNKDESDFDCIESFTKTASLIWDGDAYLELNEDVHWRFTISLSNPYIFEMKNVIVKDRLAAELEIDEIIYVSHGTFGYIIKGNTKMTWNIGDLAPGETANLLLEISTKCNKKWQEYTSPGRYELNSGATLKFKDSSGQQRSAYTGTIEFKVPGEWPYDIIYLKSVPEDSVSMTIYQFPGSNNNYLDLSLWDIPEGFDVSNGVYTGWCLDTDNFIYPGATYAPTLYSSYDPNLSPWTSDDEQWDYINYILNHQHPDATMEDTQAALWYFGDSDIPMPSDPEAKAMVEDALVNGADFVPGEGDVMAIIVDSGDNVQLTIIVIDP